MASAEHPDHKDFILSDDFGNKAHYYLKGKGYFKEIPEVVAGLFGTSRYKQVGKAQYAIAYLSACERWAGD
jgi:hypothetical protein